MKKFVLIGFLVGGMALSLPASSQAQVVLPESGRLAGPLNTALSAIGTDFFFMPEAWGTAPLITSSQSGWIEIQFGTPEGALVPFTLDFQGIGPDVFLEFSGGPQFLYGQQEVETFESLGILNLETGLVEEITVGALFSDTGISRNAITNRTFDVYQHTYPPDPNVFPVDGFPPGFVHAFASFDYDAEGRIVGVLFSGASVTPYGILGRTPAFPDYSFGAQNQATLRPLSCAPGSDQSLCPDEREGRNGVPVPPFPFDDPDASPALVHPQTIMNSNELREVSVAADLPVCSAHPRADAVGATVGERIYQIGGSYEGVDQGRLDIYDTEMQTWEAGPPMPVPTTEAQGAVIDDRIYIAGGRRFPRGPAIDVLQVFDTESGTWSQLANVPKAIANAATAVRGDRLYIFGGQTNRPNGSPAGNLRFADYVQVYDATTDTWEVRDFAFDGQRVYVADASAIANGNEIYVINGRTIGGVVTDQVVIYDTLSQSFSTGASTLWGVYNASAARVGDRLYLAGGRSELGGETENRLQIFEMPQGAWRRGLDQPVSMEASATTQSGGRLYMVGGRTMNGINTFPGVDRGVVQYYDPARGWRACDTYPLTTSGEILSSASLLTGPTEFSPGGHATILGHHLSENSAASPPRLPVPLELNGVSVTVEGESAAILAVSPNRIDFQVPFNVDFSRGKADVVITRDGSSSPPIEIAMVEFAPHIFIQYCDSADHYLMQLDASSVSCQPDGTLNYPKNPVAPGETVLVQMTGLGAVDTVLATGQRAPREPRVNALNLPTVMIEQTDGSFVEATVLSATLAPEELGIYEVEIEVPPETFISDRTFVTATMGDITSNRAGIAVGTPNTNRPISCRYDTNLLFRGCRLSNLQNPDSPLRVDR